MSTLNNSKIPIAVESRSKLDLPCDVATTSMFMLLQPVYYHRMLRTERDKISVVSNVRPNPLVTPTFGRIRQNLRAFFVPYRLVCPNFDEFQQDTVYSNMEHSSQVVGVPFFTSENLVYMFIQNGLALSTVNPGDFIYSGQNFSFTRLGRYFYKILYSLGYELVPPSKSFKFNALNILAYAKVYLDWYANSQYLNSSLVLQLERYLKYNDPVTPLELNAQDLYDILLFIRPAMYNSNGYFESAWDNPVSPNSGQYTAFNFADPTSNSGAIVTTNSLGSPEMQQANTGSTTLGTQYLHDALKKLSNYQKRHALAGARAIDRLLAQYGIKTDALKQTRSIYVGVQSNDINISSVFATADSNTGPYESRVGDYAGAGFGQGQGSWDFSTDEDGVFIVIQTIMPSGGYYQGYDRINRHLTRSEFFQPEFDALGVQIIEKGEVYVSRDLDNFASVADDYATKFGFTGRYGEYKRSINRVSGDFALPNFMSGGGAWHLMRTFTDKYFNDSLANVVHSEDFCRGTDAEQYLRIFTYTEYEFDPFNVFVHIDNTAFAPCHSLTDTYDFESDSQRVTLDSNGAKLN